MAKHVPSSRSGTSPRPVLLLGAEALMWGAGPGPPRGQRSLLVCDTGASVRQVRAREVRLDVRRGHGGAELGLRYSVTTAGPSC